MFLNVFKYCNLNSNNHTDNFLKNQIWLSNPLNFNDPYDCSITYDYEKIQNKTETAINALVDELGLNSKFKI